MLKKLLQKLFIPEITKLTKENIELIKAVKDREQDIYNMIKYEFQNAGIRSRSKWVHIFKLDEMMLDSTLTTKDELQEIKVKLEDIKKKDQ